MSRIPAIDPARADAKAQPLLDAVNKSLGVTPNLFRVAANSAAALEGLLDLNGALAKGRLDARTRETIALAVAEANGCDYCLSAHSVLGAGAGLSEADIAAARVGRATTRAQRRRCASPARSSRTAGTQPTSTSPSSGRPGLATPRSWRSWRTWR